MPSDITTLSDANRSIKQKLRKRLGPGLQRLAYSTGAMTFISRLRNCKGAIILMYHSVADNRYSHFIDPANHVPADVFHQQMHFLANNRRVIPLNELIETLKKGSTPQDGTVVITFDDGYIDNLLTAAPILDRYGLQATLFLPTSYIDRGETQWIDQAYAAFRYRSRSHLTWEAGSTALFNLDNPDQCRAAYQTICTELITTGPEKRQFMLSELCNRLEPTERQPRLTMTWDDVRTLLTRHNCFEIGGHTQEHTDLTSVSEAQAKKELTNCIQRIKDKTGTKPRYFSFCYGRTSEALRHIAADTGFEAACGGQGLDPVVNGVTDRYRLPRIAVPPSLKRFNLLTSSANTGIWRRLGRK